MKKDAENTTEQGNEANTMLAPVLYPEYSDILNCCKTIYFSEPYALSEIIGKENAENLKNLAQLFMYKYPLYKEKIITDLLAEIEAL
jgi:hypothetical protein